MGAGVVKYRFRHAGLHEARAHGVHTNIVGAKITCSGHGEINHSSLGGAVSVASRAGSDTSNRSSVNNRTEFAGLHVGRNMFDKQHGANEVNGQHTVPLLSLVFCYRRMAFTYARNACDIAQDVDLPERFNSLADQFFYLNLLGNVDGAPAMFSACGHQIPGFNQARLGSIRHHHLGTLTGQS